MPLSFASEAEADSFIDNDTTTASLEAEPVAVKSPAAISSSGGPAPLFGMETTPLIGGAIPEKWTRARAEIAREFESLERCRTDGACPVVAQRLMDLSAEGTGRSGRARVGLINRAVDLAISPTSDDTQWGIDDRWSAPFETLRSGRGDCEDYAIVKYLALLEAGVSEDDVKIVILKNAFPSEDHAVLAARVDGDWLILDNRTLTLVRDMDLRRVTPEFVLDRRVRGGSFRKGETGALGEWRASGCLSDRQIPMLGNHGCDEIHHGAYCWRFAQVAVNHEPDVTREGRDVLVNPDKISLSIGKKARQAGHTHPGPHGDQMLADVVQFASHRTIAGDAEEPALLRHLGVVLIEGDELPPFGLRQVSIGSMRIETESHCSDFASHAGRFIRPHEPHGNIGFTTT